MEEKYPTPYNIFSLWSIFSLFPCSPFLLQILYNPLTLCNVDHSTGFCFISTLWIREPPFHLLIVAACFSLSRSLWPIFSSVCSQWLHVSRGTASVSCPRSKPAMCTAAWRWQPLLLCSSRPSQSHTSLGTQERERKQTEIRVIFQDALLFLPMCMFLDTAAKLKLKVYTNIKSMVCSHKRNDNKC